MPRIVTVIRDALRPDPYREPAVHFHAIDGRPEVCHDLACSRPRLDA